MTENMFLLFTAMTRGTEQLYLQMYQFENKKKEILLLPKISSRIQEYSRGSITNSQARRSYPISCVCQDTCLQLHWPQESVKREDRCKPDCFFPAAAGMKEAAQQDPWVKTCFAILIFINATYWQCRPGCCVQVPTASCYIYMLSNCREWNAWGVKRMLWLWLEKEDEEVFPEAQPSNAPFWLKGKAGLHPWAAQPP